MRKLLNCGHVSDKANGTLHPYKSYHCSCPVFLGSDVHFMHAVETVGFCVDFLLFWVGLGGDWFVCCCWGGLFICLFVLMGLLFQLVR